MGIYKRKQENALSTKKAIKKKRKKKKENTLSTKKAIKRNENGQEKKERKHALDHESDQEKKKTFFISYFLLKILTSLANF